MTIPLVHDTCKAFPSTSKAFLSTSCETAHENLKKLMIEVYKVFRTFCSPTPSLVKEKGSWPSDWAEYFPNSQSVVQFCTKIKTLNSRFKFSYFTSSNSTEDHFLSIQKQQIQAYEALKDTYGNALENAREVCDVILFNSQALEKRISQAVFNVFDSCRWGPPSTLPIADRIINFLSSIPFTLSMGLGLVFLNNNH